MKKAIQGIMGIIFIVIVISVITSALNNSKPQKIETSKNTNTVESKQHKSNPIIPIIDAKSLADLMIFSNISIKKVDLANYTEVLGEVKNTDTANHTFAFTVTFFDSNNNILGTCIGSMSDLQPGQTKTFTATGSGNYTKAPNYKIQIDAIM